MNIGKLGLGIVSFLGGAAAIGVAAMVLGRRAAPGEEGHAAPDLAADADRTARAPVAFRPDMDAPMTPAEREALRPATGPSPTLADAATSLPAAG